MPLKNSFKDWKEYYEDERFWLKVKKARQLMPHPEWVNHKDYFVVRLGTGLMISFRKFYFTTRNGKSLFGQSTIDKIWMFDTICDPDQYWEVDLDLKKK